MSYDLRIWSINPANFPDSLPQDEKLELGEGSARIEKRDWQIVINESAKVEEEDIPGEVSPALPGIKYVTELNLEPIHAPEPAKRLLIKTAKYLAKDVIGVVEDPQEDTIMAPSGMKRFVAPSRVKDERFSILEMAWWFGDNPLSKEEILLKLVDYFERNLPDALPRRYGEYEPPQHKYQETGKDHFKKYLSEHVYDSVVWYPMRPVVGIYYHFKKDWGFYQWRNRKEFGSNVFRIQFDSALLSQPGWKDQLLKVFKDISLLLNPFYGEVRTLHNQIYARGTIYSDMKTEHNPTPSGFWKGIPQKLGQAIIIGEPYLPLLPKYKEKGKMIGSLCLLSTEDWVEGKSLNAIVGNVPKDIAQRKIPQWVDVRGKSSLPFANRVIGQTFKYNDEFPPNFPFDEGEK